MQGSWGRLGRVRRCLKLRGCKPLQIHVDNTNTEARIAFNYAVKSLRLGHSTSKTKATPLTLHPIP